jgi:hypothetical protein
MFENEQKELEVMEQEEFSPDPEIKDEEEGKQELSESSTVDPIEELAEEFGWDRNGKKPAREFILGYKEIQKKIRDDLKRSSRSQKETLKNLSNELSELRKEIVSSKSGNELESLRKQHRIATEEGDPEKAEEALDKIIALELKNKEKKVAGNGNPKEELESEFKKWRDKNSWYKQDDEKTRFVDDKFNELVKEYGDKFNPNEYPEFYFEEIDDALQTEYKPKKSKMTIPSQEVSGHRPSNSKRKATFNDIKNHDIKEMALYTQRKGGFEHFGKTKQEQLDGYAQELRNEGVI